MQKIRHGIIITLWMLLCSVTSAAANVSIGIGLPNVSIGINLPLLPELVPVPGYPVYYAPRVEANYFFYDGMYWVYQDDNWYASSWYNGPWGLVDPDYVPLFILRIPVHYYVRPPVYFHGWRPYAPPRWGEHWGHRWEQHRRGWDRWDRGHAPSRAPLPVYQRQYPRDRYPGVEQQHRLRGEHYRYQPRETLVRRHYDQRVEQRAPVPAQRGRVEAPPVRSQRQEDYRHSKPLPQGGPAGPSSQPPQRGEEFKRSAPEQHPQQRGPVFKDQKPQPGAAPHMQQAPKSHGQEQRSHENVKSQEINRGHGQGQMKDEERGREHHN